MATMYLEDLAHIQHVRYGGFAQKAAPGLLSLLRAAGIHDGPVVDLGCGSGGFLRALAHAGYAALGVDHSPSLIAIARRVAPRSKVCVASVYGFDLPPCEAVTAIGEVLSYCPPGGRAAPPLARYFRRVAAALKPGGLFVFDLLVPSRGRPMVYRTWEAGDRWAVLIDVVEEPRRGRLTRSITTFRRVGGRYRRSSERHVLRILPPASVVRWLRAAGFAVRLSRCYGSMALMPRRLAFLARKRR